MRTGLCLATLAITLFYSNDTNAEPPRRNASYQSKEESPDARLKLSERCGPWMIYAASFAGENAQREAFTLASELRRKHKFRAYVHSEQYDFSQSVNGIGLNRDRTPRKMKFYRSDSFDEFAVLVGDFASVDDPDLQEALKEIKFLRPECLTKAKENTTRRFAGLRDHLKRLNGDEKKSQRGPMGSAFATPNPLMARETYAPQGVDQFVLNMNKRVKHSLLDCPKKFSVRVATFRGSVVTDQRKVKEIEAGGHDLESKLEEAAVNAHRLTEALRKRGEEAYEFHDRHESYVTIGSFDYVGKPRADGKQEMNPAILQVIKKFGATGSSGTFAKTKRLSGITLDAQPWPVEVPRRSLAMDYSSDRRMFR